MAIKGILPATLVLCLTLVTWPSSARAQTGGVSAANQFGGLNLAANPFVTNVPIDLRGVPLVAGAGQGVRNDAFLAYRERVANRVLRARILRQQRYEQNVVQRSRYQSPPGATFNPGFTLPQTIGHFNTRFGLVTGASLGR